MSTEENNKEQIAGEAVRQDLTDQYANKSDEKESPRYSNEELRNFKTIISNKLDEANDQLKYLIIVKGDRAKGLRIEGFEETPVSEIENMVQVQKDYISALNDELVRIKNKTFGVDIRTGKLIPKEILIQQPVTSVSIFPDVENNIKARACRVCGCTDNDCSQCTAKTGEACHWVEEDLCSACVEESNVPDQPIKDAASPSLKEWVMGQAKSADTEQETNVSSNNTDMNFFQQLAQASAQQTDLTIRILQKDNKLTLNIVPGSKSTTLKPILVTGTAQELDEGFFKTIAPGISEIKGLVTNIGDVKKDLAEKKDKPAPEASAEKKEDKKPPEKKPAKKAPVKKEKPAPVEKPAEPTLL